MDGDSASRTHSTFTLSPWLTGFFLGWFILALILVSRRMHLYAPIQLRNTLHDQRLTIQACFTAGLLLCGGLYVIGRGKEVSRGVVLLTIVFTAILLSARRLVWRAIVYRRYDRGIETRNILVVGTGRVGQALRHHIESIRHLGFTFKGFVRRAGSGFRRRDRRREMCWERSTKFSTLRASILWMRSSWRLLRATCW